ncbi:hypothetical protein [Pseudomonas sp. UYIF39]|nr:hypothetical protein [Pseudomonas sp. UYIF39]
MNVFLHSLGWNDAIKTQIDQIGFVDYPHKVGISDEVVEALGK